MVFGHGNAVGQIRHILVGRQAPLVGLLSHKRKCLPEAAIVPNSLPTRNPIVNQILPYISVGLDDKNRCIVVVEDYELFDFIDDFLGDECDLPYEYRTTKERPGGEIITMYFPLTVTPETIERNLLKLSPEEIERIYKLNN
jgi:hypothetical protein